MDPIDLNSSKIDLELPPPRAKRSRLLMLCCGVTVFVIVLSVLTVGYQWLTYEGGHNDPRNASSFQQLPSFGFLTRGVDITTLDLLPIPRRPPAGFKRALFDFTYTNGRNWSHPNRPDITYGLPDQVRSVGSQSARVKVVKKRLPGTLENVKQWLAGHTGVAVDWGSFSASGSYKRAKEALIKFNSTIFELFSPPYSFAIEFEPSQLQPDIDFLDAINDQLSGKYEDTPTLYDAFIESFGTHYIRAATFGGYLRYQSTIQNRYLAEVGNETAIEWQMRARAPFGSVGSKSTLNATAIDEQFDRHSTSNFFTYYGGVMNSEHPDLVEWSKSIHKEPWLIMVRLEPISSLIANETIRAEVQKAIKVKGVRAFVKDIEETVDMGGLALKPDDVVRFGKSKQFVDQPENGLKNWKKTEEELKLLQEGVEKLLAEKFYG